MTSSILTMVGSTVLPVETFVRAEHSLFILGSGVGIDSNDVPSRGSNDVPDEDSNDVPFLFLFSSPLGCGIYPFRWLFYPDI